MNEKNLSIYSDENSNIKKDEINSNELNEDSGYNLPKNINEIEYPFKEIKYIPLSIGTIKEQCFLYLSNYDFKFFDEQRKEYFNYHFKDKESDLFKQLEEDIFTSFGELYSEFSLVERLKISSTKLNSIKPNYSFAFEMSESLKTSSFVKKKINDYIYIKNDILKNLDFDKKNILTHDPFSSFRINSLKNTEKKLYPKFAKSIRAKKESDSSDDEDLNEKEEPFIAQVDNYKSYKDILKRLFIMNDLRKDLINYCLDNDENFDNNDFEKFICYLEYFITLFTGIQVKYTIDELGLLNMDFYASENIFMKMAEILHYIAQFQIRDESYYKGEKKLDIKDLTNEKYQDYIIGLNIKQYGEYDFDQPEYFPVYTSFMSSLAHNFRRYDKNDLYHLCKECVNVLPQKILSIECDSSLFRFIDKTRLIHMTLLSILDMGYIEKMIKSESNHINQIFKSSMFLRNESIINNFNKNLNYEYYLFPFKKNNSNSKKIDFFFKNTFGEAIGYFYIWISHYLSWLIFPTIAGIIFEIISLFVSEKQSNYVNLIFLSIIILWGFYYTEDWNCWQIFYKHIWGINGYIAEKSNLFDENYKNVPYITFLDIKMAKMSNLQYIKNLVTSFFTLFFMIIFIIFANIIVFYVYKLQKINKFFIISYKYQVPVLILIIREAISKLIYKITKKFARLENPTDKDKYLEIVTRKRLILEYVNYYFNLYYIAFYHKLAGKCNFSTCLVELNTQLIMLLIADTLLVIGKLFYKYFYLRKTKKSFENTLMKISNNREETSQSHSTSTKFKIYTREEFSEENSQKIILPIIFHFGYVIQFGACFPISFLFLFILVIFCRIADAFSMVELFYVKAIEASKGLKGYNRMQTRMLFIGIFTNIGVIFFTKGKSFLEKDMINALFTTLLVENIIFLVFKTFNIVHFPFWFRYKDNIKLNYLKKFGVIPRNKKEKYNDNLKK